MTNLFHLVLRPHGDGDLNRWMLWVMTSHVRRYRRHYHGSGHVWLGRFKAIPIQADQHDFAVLRYVERNPLQANLVERSQDWESLRLNLSEPSCPGGLMSEGPVAKPAEWTRFVNGIEAEAELAAIRQSVDRGTPFGDAGWNQTAAALLGIESSLRPHGRPRRFLDGQPE